MADLDLRTDYKDDILDSSVNEKRKYNIIENEDGTKSLEDVSVYTQNGDSFGAADINKTNQAVLDLNQSLSELNENFSQAHDALVASLAYSGLGITEDMTFAEIAEILAEAFPAQLAFYKDGIFQNGGLTNSSATSYTNNGSYLTYTATTNSTKSIYTASTDVSNYSTLHVIIKSDAQRTMYFYYDSTSTKLGSSFTLPQSSTFTEYTADISSLTGSHVLGFTLNGIGTFYVESFWVD